jgi:hypothetical protein
MMTRTQTERTETQMLYDHRWCRAYTYPCGKVRSRAALLHVNSCEQLRHRTLRAPLVALDPSTSSHTAG